MKNNGYVSEILNISNDEVMSNLKTVTAHAIADMETKMSSAGPGSIHALHSLVRQMALFAQSAAVDRECLPMGCSGTEDILDKARHFLVDLLKYHIPAVVQEVSL